MSQPLITNGSISAIGPKNTKDITEINGMNKEVPVQVQQSQASQPNVRHIPIFVEGRDEPIFNKNLDTTTVDAPITRPVPVINDIPQPGSIFNRAKDIPVKKIVPEFKTVNVGRSGSPARTIPINVVHTQSNKTTGSTHPHPSPPAAQQPSPQQSHPQQHSQHQQEDPQPQQTDRRSQSPKPPPVDPITKIQNIQQEILELMDKVEKYEGGSRKAKEYIYLDEMLTQNLLKLDLIDTEGKENIKAARKEAINCINKCIQVLEAKAENVERSVCENESNDNTAEGNTSKEGEENNKNTENRGNRGNSGTRKEKPPQVQGPST